MKNFTSTILALMLASSLSSHAAVVVVDGWTVIDNSFTNDATMTYTQVGSWSNVGETDHWGSNAKFGNSTGATVTWDFLGLANGIYEVAVSWSHGSNRPADAPFSVQGDSAIPVNQKVIASGGPTLNDGTDDIPFALLTTTAIVTDGTLDVVLTDTVGGNPFPTADAVAIRQVVPEPSSTALLGLGGLALALRRRRA